MMVAGTNKYTDDFYSKVIGSKAYPATIFNSFLGSDDDYEQIRANPTRKSLRTALYGSEYPTGNPQIGVSLGIGLDISLASSRYIYTFGDIIPMVDDFNNLGASQHNFGSLYIDTIHGSYLYSRTLGGANDTLRINMKGSLLPVGANIYDLGHLDSKWTTLYALYLGRDVIGDQSDWIDAGYIKNLEAINLSVSSQINMSQNAKMIFGDGWTISNNQILPPTNDDNYYCSIGSSTLRVTEIWAKKIYQLSEIDLSFSVAVNYNPTAGSGIHEVGATGTLVFTKDPNNGQITVKCVFDNGGGSGGCDWCCNTGTYAQNGTNNRTKASIEKGLDIMNINLATVLAPYFGTFTMTEDIKTDGGWDGRRCEVGVKSKYDEWKDMDCNPGQKFVIDASAQTVQLSTKGTPSDNWFDSNFRETRHLNTRQVLILTDTPSFVLKITGNTVDNVSWEESK